MNNINKSTNTGLISIIIATFNAESLLLKCLESIKNQKYTNIEIIVVDGKSTDNTIKILESFQHSGLTWTSEKDTGIYDALNKGINLAKGDWLYFLGSDDYLLNGFSELALLLENKNSVYYGNSESFYLGKTKPSYEVLKCSFTSYGLTKYCINHQSIIYPKTVFKQYHYNLKYKVFADYALNIQVWGDASFQKVYYPISIVNYNMSGFSSVTNDEEFLKDKPALIRKNMGLLVYIRYMLRRYKRRKRGHTDFG